MYRFRILFSGLCRLRGNMSESSDAKKGGGPSPEEMAKMLDEEFEAYLSNLGGKEYKDGWSEDNWEEEMEKHPAFMTKTDFAAGEVPPLVEAFQQLKYGEEDNTPQELAQNYKDEGNRHFQLKKYRFAIANYTEGLKQKSGDAELDAILLANRAASHFRLGNYGHAIVDCGRAVALSPKHLKATRRGLDACLKLGKWDEAKGWLHRLKQLEPGNEKELRQIENQITVGEKKKARDERKAAVATQKVDDAAQKLRAAVALRGVKFSGSDKLEGPDGKTVIMNEDGSLSWPVLFIYPEPSVTELVEAFHEDATLEAHLHEMFTEKPDWDFERKYDVANFNVFFEIFDTERDEIVSVPITKTLGEVLAHPKYKIKDGMATFIVFVRNTAAEKFFLSKNAVHDWSS